MIIRGLARRVARVAALGAVATALVAGAALASTVGPIDFESYALGNVNGQNGWSKTGAYDVEVASIASFPAAAGYGFGTKALRLSDSVTTGAFGDQTFSPALTSAAGETATQSHLSASFKVGTALATLQPGLHMSVSPDSGDGSRMSYLRFEDQADGVHVFFDDVTDPGPLGAVANFNETDIATLDRAHSHSIVFAIDFKAGAGNDVVTITIDGVVTATGTTWEDYYRYDPEQLGNGNQVPNVAKLLFRESGGANPANAGNGFLVDSVSLVSSNPVQNADQCKKNGWKTLTRADGSSFKNQGDCVSYTKNGK